MTPQEIKHGSPQTSTSAVPDVDEPMSKDLIDGDRVLALQALNKYQAQTKAWRDNAVIPREFNKGDLVLVGPPGQRHKGKLEPKWEGPFIVKTKASPNAYRLSTVAELPELFQLKCLSPALEARPHLNGNNQSIPRI
jgi:hypothetical protein